MGRHRFVLAVIAVLVLTACGRMPASTAPNTSVLSTSVLSTSVLSTSVLSPSAAATGESSTSATTPGPDAASAPAASSAPATPSPLVMPSPGDPSFPVALYPAPKTTALAGLVGGCPSMDGVPRIRSGDELDMNVQDYAAAISATTSPYVRADRAMWPAIAASFDPVSTQGPTMDLKNVSVDWGKGYRELLRACGDETAVESTVLQIGLTAASADRGYAFFIPRGGHLLLYAVKNLPVVGAWTAPPPAPGRILDTTHLTLTPHVVLSAAGLATVLRGNTRTEWNVAVSPERVFVARGSGAQHETDRRGELTAVDRQSGAVLWRAPVPGCDSQHAQSGTRVWVWPACDTKEGYAAPQSVEEFDAATGNVLHRYEMFVSALVTAGNVAWVLAGTDGAKLRLVRLEDGMPRDLITLEPAGFGPPLHLQGGDIWVVANESDPNRYTLLRIDGTTGHLRGRTRLTDNFGGLLAGDGPPYALIQGGEDGPAGTAAIDPESGALGPAVATHSWCVAKSSAAIWCVYMPAARQDPSYVVAYAPDGTVLEGGILPQDARNFGIVGTSLVLSDGKQVLSYGD